MARLPGLDAPAGRGKGLPGLDPPAGRVSTVYVKPSLKESAKYVGESYLEGGRNLLSLLLDINNLPARMSGQETLGSDVNAFLEELGVGTPDENIVGWVPRTARTVMNAEAAPGGPITNLLAGLGSSGMREAGFGPYGQMAGALMAGSLPQLIERLPSSLAKFAEKFDRTALGFTRAPKSRFVRAKGEAAADTAARDLIEKGVFPAFKTPERNMTALNNAFEEAGERYKDFGAQAQTRGGSPSVPLTTHADDFIENVAPPSQKQMMRDWYREWRINFANGWDGKFSSLGDEITSLGRKAFEGLKDRIPPDSIRALEAAVRKDLVAARNEGLNMTLGAGTSGELGELNRTYKSLSDIQPTIESAANRANHMNPGTEAMRTLFRFAWPELAGYAAGMPGLGSLMGTVNAAVRNPTVAGLIGSTSRLAGRVASPLAKLMEMTGEIAPFGTMSTIPSPKGNPDAIPQKISNIMDMAVPEAGAEELSPGNRVHFNIPVSEMVIPKNFNLEDFRDAVIQAESGGRPLVTSPKGAQGLMQIMPATFKEQAQKLGLVNADPFDPEVNKMVGTAYLQSQLEKYDDPRLALAAYNWGPGNLDRLMNRTGLSTADELMGHFPGETQNYIKYINGLVNLG